MASFQEHLAYLTKHGVARNNRFQVLIPIPERLIPETSNTDQNKTSLPFSEEVVSLISSFTSSGASQIARGLDIMVESTALPAKTLTTTNIRYNSDFHDVPYSVVYNQQDLSFHVSTDMYEKNIIDLWMASIVDPVTHEVAYMDDYATNITINQLNEQDEIVYSVALIDAFPVTCNSIEVTNESQNTMIRLSTSFAYKRWIPVGENISDETGLVDSLSQTPIGPLVTPILSNPAVQKGLDFLENQTGLDLEGEAVAIYNQIDSIVRNTTGTSVNKTFSLLESIKASIGLNDKITSTQAASLIDTVDKLLERMGS